MGVTGEVTGGAGSEVTHSRMMALEAYLGDVASAHQRLPIG